MGVRILYLTIALRARDFYEVVLSPHGNREQSNCFSRIRDQTHKILHKNIENRVVVKNAPENLLLAIYRGLVESY